MLPRRGLVRARACMRLEHLHAPCSGAGSPLTPAIRLRPNTSPLTFSSLPVPRAVLNGCHPHLFLLLRNRFYILLRGHDPAPPSSPPPNPSPHFHPSSGGACCQAQALSLPGGLPASSDHLKAHVAHPLTESPRPRCSPRRWAWFSDSPPNFIHLAPTSDLPLGAHLPAPRAFSLTSSRSKIGLISARFLSLGPLFMSLRALPQAIPTSPERKCNVQCPKLYSWTFSQVSSSWSETPSLPISGSANSHPPPLVFRPDLPSRHLAQPASKSQ